jgi:hypothetical protein
MVDGNLRLPLEREGEEEMAEKNGFDGVVKNKRRMIRRMRDMLLLLKIE